MKPQLILIGLGNPGASYECTRHNVGFLAIDRLFEEVGEGEWQEKQKFNAWIAEGRIVTVPVLLVKPMTYMNLSADAARKIVDFYKLDPSKQIIVFCDDVDLPLGEIRFRKKGGPGTHNGLKSLVDTFGEDFPRMRIGLGTNPPGSDLSSWVLSTIPKEEMEKFKEAFLAIPEMVKQFVMGSEDND